MAAILRQEGAMMGDRVGAIVLAAATLIGVLVCVLMAAPFLGALTWALVIALVVAAPAAFVLEKLVEDGASSAAMVQRSVASGALQSFLDDHPGIAPIGIWVQRQIDLPTILASLAGWLSNVGASFARRSVLQLIEIVLTFYLLFFFLRDRRAAARLLQEWLPLTHAESRRLFDRVVETVQAIVYGTVAVAVVQGTLGGLMFWVLGLPTPLLWGLMMGVLTIVPVVGWFIVWLPAVVFLAIEGSWIKAVILAFFGVVIVGGGIQNVLYPILVGNRLKLHTVATFISIIGGLILFGPPGFILGPLAVTVTALLLEIWRGRDQAKQPKRQDIGLPSL
jgi:predicted PurR-regulated permease PerM